MAARINSRVKWLCLALALVAFAAPEAAAQLAPTGGHYGGKASDTGFTGGVTSSGGYSASVPLDLPPSRGGIPIPFSIVYGAHGVGAAGLGWDIPISYVRVDSTFARRRPAFLVNAAPQPRSKSASVAQPNETLRGGCRIRGSCEAARPYLSEGRDTRPRVSHSASPQFSHSSH